MVSEFQIHLWFIALSFPQFTHVGVCLSPVGADQFTNHHEVLLGIFHLLHAGSCYVFRHVIQYYAFHDHYCGQKSGLISSTLRFLALTSFATVLLDESVWTVACAERIRAVGLAGSFVRHSDPAFAHAYRHFEGTDTGVRGIVGTTY